MERPTLTSFLHLHDNCFLKCMYHILKCITYTWYLLCTYLCREFDPYNIEVSSKNPLILLNSRFLSCTGSSMLLFSCIFIYTVSCYVRKYKVPKYLTYIYIHTLYGVYFRLLFMVTQKTHSELELHCVTKDAISTLKNLQSKW